jgi:hypothetical protein
MENIPLRDCAQSSLFITAFPLGAGQFVARCGGAVTVARTQHAFLDGARALLAAGHSQESDFQCGRSAADCANLS